MAREGGKDSGAPRQETRIDSPEIIFGIDHNFDEHVGQLREACDTNDLDTIAALLRENKFIENIVVRKGKNKELLVLLERAVNALVQQEIGKNVGEILDAKELERVIKSGKLPPFAAAELAGAFYHLKRDDESNKLAGLIIGVEDSTIGVVSKANAYNTLGCIYLRDGNQEGSLEANKAGLTLLNNQPNAGLNTQWQKDKLLHGTYIDKRDSVGELPAKKERAILENVRGKLFALQNARRVYGDVFNAPRVYLDAARICIRLKNIPLAREYAKDARDQMAQVGYLSGAEQASELLKEL